jgi:hypothetical protein
MTCTIGASTTASGVRTFILRPYRRIVCRSFAVGVATLAVAGLIAGSVMLGAKLVSASFGTGFTARARLPVGSVLLARASPYGDAWSAPDWSGSVRRAFDFRLVRNSPDPRFAGSVLFVSAAEADPQRPPGDSLEITNSVPQPRDDQPGGAHPEIDLAALELARLASSRPTAVLDLASPAATPPASALGPAKPAPPRPSALRLPKLASLPPVVASRPGSRTDDPQVDGNPLLGVDRRTAVYDISAHTVYLPDGTRLEAHSGLGSNMDNPRHVALKNRGPTPPNTYDLTMREQLFHGVRAIRLNPVSGSNMFGRDGMLAHTYMLGPNGQSNGCVSFKNYPAFLRAFLNGEVKRMIVVARLADLPGRGIASPRAPAGRYAFNPE